MKMYLLKTENYDGVDIHGLFSTKQKAIESFPFQPESLDESNIEEIEVDPPHGPEQYEMFFSAVACTDGKSWINDQPNRLTQTQVESTTPHLSWDTRYNRGSVLCYGKTKEEAATKAIAGLPLIQPVWQVARFRCGKPGFNKVRHAHPSLVHKWNEPHVHIGYAVHKDLDTARKILIEYETTGIALPGYVKPT